MTKKDDLENNDYEIFKDLKYICKSTPLILESLQNGSDVAQLSNGDLIITEVKTINTQYIWDSNKSRMMKSNKI